MLRTRVITAVFLLSGLLLAVFFLPPLGWALFVAVIAGLAGWEFGRLAGFTAAANIGLGVVTALLCGLLVAGSPGLLDERGPGSVERALLTISAGFWLLAAPFWLRRRWPLKPAVVAVVVALLLIVPTWVSLVILWKIGPATLFGVMALVWIADIAAYFAGRRFGRHKLAPSISPGKTWEGVWGAIAAVTLYGLMLLALGLLPGIPLWLAVVMLPLLTMISVEGDLFESLLKRQAGLKDSSGLLPGHGGILDRIDSLTSTLPIATLILLR